MKISIVMKYHEIRNDWDNCLQVLW